MHGHRLQEFQLWTRVSITVHQSEHCQRFFAAAEQWKQNELPPSVVARQISFEMFGTDSGDPFRRGRDEELKRMIQAEQDALLFGLRYLPFDDHRLQPGTTNKSHERCARS